MATALSSAADDERAPPFYHHPNQRLPILTIGALGVVFGDIGTSPLYALQATLDPRYHLGIDVTDLYGIVSLIFWSFVFVVTIK
jgi:KUP system potassium uptake protein